jgi:hypothetical protein
VTAPASQHRAAAVGGGRHDKARAQDSTGDAGRGDQPLGFALGGGKGGAISFGDAGDRYLHEADGAAAVADRLQQPRDKIAMHGVGVAAGAILQHAEAVDDEVDGALAQQPCQRRRIHRHDRQFEIERTLLGGGEFSRDADDRKSPRT